MVRGSITGNEAESGGGVYNKDAIDFSGVEISGNKANKEDGAGIIEYALILILVGIIIFVLVTLLGPAISKFISDLMASV